MARAPRGPSIGRTSVTAPAPKFNFGGNDEQYLYHNSTLALDPDTGEIVWYYQHIVDHWDLDHPFERLLVDFRGSQFRPVGKVAVRRLHADPFLDTPVRLHPDSGGVADPDDQRHAVRLFVVDRA